MVLVPRPGRVDTATYSERHGEDPSPDAAAHRAHPGREQQPLGTQLDARPRGARDGAGGGESDRGTARGSLPSFAATDTAEDAFGNALDVDGPDVDTLLEEALRLRAALDVLWLSADLSYLLRPYQLEVRTLVARATRRVVVHISSRRIGKTWNSCTLALEAALRTPFARVCFAFPTQKLARSVVVPTMQDILQDCPANIAPVFNQTELTWKFPHNGSLIVLAGCDDKGAADNLRGTKMDFGVVDEAGFHKHLDYVLKSVLGPQTLTTNGRILVISSPPESPSHPLKRIYESALADGAATIHTLDVAVPWLPAQEESKEEYIREAGGMEASTCRREYYAEFVTDETKAVIPEFSKCKNDLIGIIEPAPTYRDLYVSADFGFNDLTAVIFGYYHFERALIIIEDELVFRRTGALEVASRIKQHENTIWKHRTKDPYRFADVPLQILTDIANYGGIHFGQVMKDDKMAAINNLRMMCSNKRFLIHPRCVNLIAHLQNAIWNEKRTTFARTDDDGHFDFVDSMVYMVRHVAQHMNPNPILPAGVTHATHFIPPHLQTGINRGTESLVEAFRSTRWGS